MFKIALISYLLVASSLAIQVKVEDKTPTKLTKVTKEKKSEKRDAPIVSSGYDYSEPSHVQPTFGNQGISVPSDSYGTPLGAPLNEHSYAAFGSAQATHGAGEEAYGNALSGGDFAQLMSQLGGDHSYLFGGQSQEHGGHEVAGSYEAPNYAGLDYSALSQGHAGSEESHVGASQVQYKAPHYTTIAGLQTGGHGGVEQSIGHSQGGAQGASHGISSSYGAPEASSYANIDFGSLLGQSHGSIDTNSFSITPSKEISFSYGAPSTGGHSSGIAQTYKAPSHASSGSSSQQFGYVSSGSHGVSVPAVSSGSHGISSSYGAPAVSSGSHGISSSYGAPAVSSGSHGISSSYGAPAVSSGSHGISSSYGAPSVSTSGSSGSFKSYSAPVSTSYGAPSHSSGSSQSFGSHSLGGSYKAPASFSHGISHGISHGNSFGSSHGISHGSSGISSSYGAPSFSSHGGSSSFGGHQISHKAPQEQAPSYAAGHKGLRHYSGPSSSHISHHGPSHGHISSGPSSSSSYFSSSKGPSSGGHKIIPMTYSKVPISSFSSFVQSKPHLHQSSTAFKPSAYLGSISEDSYSSHGGSQGGHQSYEIPTKSYIPPKKTYIPANHGPPASSYGVPSSHNYLHQGSHHGGESSYYHH